MLCLKIYQNLPVLFIYLESLFNTLYCDIKFISKYWKMNSKSWQDGPFHGTKWRENYASGIIWTLVLCSGLIYEVPVKVRPVKMFILYKLKKKNRYMYLIFSFLSVRHERVRGRFQELLDRNSWNLVEL
jgi:hypothetical protein